MAPKVNGFANAYVKNISDIKDGALDDSLRSFMDKGEAAFEDETVGGNSRSSIIEGVRKNILEKMRQENRASEASADKISAEHTKVASSLLAKVIRAKNLKREMKRSDVQYMGIHGKRTGKDREWALSYLDSLIADAEADQEADRKTKSDAEEEARRREEENEFVPEGLPGSGEEGATDTGSGKNTDMDSTGTVPEENSVTEQEDQEEQSTMSELRHQGRVGARKKQRGKNASEVSDTSMKERQSDIDYYKAIRDEILATDPSKTLKITQIFRFAGLRSWSNRKKNNSRQNEYAKLVTSINQEAENWTKIREKYANNVYKQHYNNYDSMAKSYYEVTQEFALNGNSEEADDEKKLKRAIPVDAEKNIAEYTGIFDTTGLKGLMGRIEGNPYVNVESIPIIESKKTRADAGEQGGNSANTTTHRKYHRRIVMYSQADDNGLKTRMKFRHDFSGKRSKRQFSEEDPTALTAVKDADADYFKEMYASDANLESDETDINGRKLHSEKSMEILSARSWGLKKVQGFYLNNEFYTNQKTKKPGQRIWGKKDMTLAGRVNWNKQEKAEQLRKAIRNSVFFQHVNAATIQYYSSYDSGDDYTAGIQWQAKKLWDKRAEGENGVDKTATIKAVIKEPTSIKDDIPKKMWGPVACEYIKTKLKAKKKKEAFPAGDPLSDKLLEKLKDEKEAMQSLLTLLLSDEDPKLWSIARKIIVDGGESIVAGRTIKKMEFFPESGEMMRMGLLEELINHQDDNNEDIDSEELQNKRGVGAWFKRNFKNGKFMKEAMGVLLMGFSPEELAAMGGAGGEGEESEEGGQETGTDQKCQESFDKTQKEGSALESALGTDSESKEGSEESGEEESEEKNGGGLDLSGIKFMFIKVKGTVKKIWGGLKAFYRKYLKKKTEAERQIEEQKEREKLKDQDLTTLRQALKYITSLLSFGDSIRAWIAGSGNWAGLAVLGTIQEFSGPIQWIFDTARNLIGIVDDIIEIVVTSRRIKRIDKADNEIETALTAFEQSKAPSVGNTGEQKGSGSADKSLVDLGKAANENSQAQYFMALSKAHARKTRSHAGWDIAARGFTIAKDTTKQMAMKGEVISLIATAGLNLAAKTTQFIGWVVGKLKYDRSNFNDNIAAMLGDKEYAKYPYFDRVLKRETGIVSSSYLVDLARIFTSIDTHVLLNKDTPDKSSGEMELAKKVAGTLYGNVTDDNIRHIDFRKLLAYSGFDGDSDWRSVLRNSIGAKKG